VWSPVVPSRPQQVTTTPSGDHTRTVLVTGATGVVGSALLPALAGHRVIALVHHRDAPEWVRSVRGDLTQPALGLCPARYDELAEQVDVIVHAAAVTDFTAGAAATSDLNVAGTQQIIQLARDAGATVHYLSTAFVTRTDLTRADVGDAAADPTDYLASKRVAELMVREAGVPATIIRPSMVIGHSRTGRIAAFQGLHSLASAVLRNALPLLPLDPKAWIDMVPSDVLADAIAGLVTAGVDYGELWVTAGAAALTVDRMVDLLVDVGSLLGLASVRPRLVPPEMVDRLVRPVFINPLPRVVRRRFDDMVAMTALFAGAEPFPSSLADMPGGRPLTPAGLEAAFAASVVYLAQTKGYLRSNRVAA